MAALQLTGLNSLRAVPRVQSLSVQHVCCASAPASSHLAARALVCGASRTLVGQQRLSRARSPAFSASAVANFAVMASAAAAKRVLVPIANGSEDIESVTIIDVLRRAGADVTVASVEPTLDVKFSWGIKVQADILITDIAGQTFDLIAVPGGMPGSERLRDSAPLSALLQAQAAASRPYAAMCAAPAVVLEPQGLLQGRAATAHPAWTAKLAGGGGASVEARVVIDGNVATSRGPGTALEFGLALVEMLYGAEKVKDLAGKMVVSQPPAKAVPNEWLLPV